MVNLSKMGKDDILIIDGALGTEFERRGYDTSKGAGIYTIEEKDLLKSIHEDYLKAGAQVITTNTLTANEYFMSDKGYDFKEIIRRSIYIAGESIKSSKNGYMAQVIGPCKYLIGEDLENAKLKEAFKSQIIDESQNVHYILVETMYLFIEAKIALESLKSVTDKPIMVTLVVDDKGNTFDGVSIEDAAKALVNSGASAVGVNCVEIGEPLLDILERLANTVTTPIIVRPNLGKPVNENSLKVYTKSAEEFICFIERAITIGVKVVGGCCGTTPQHIRFIRDRKRCY